MASPSSKPTHSIPTGSTSNPSKHLHGSSYTNRANNVTGSFPSSSFSPSSPSSSSRTLESPNNTLKSLAKPTILNGDPTSLHLSPSPATDSTIQFDQKSLSSASFHRNARSSPSPLLAPNLPLALPALNAFQSSWAPTSTPPRSNHRKEQAATSLATSSSLLYRAPGQNDPLRKTSEASASTHSFGAHGSINATNRTRKRSRIVNTKPSWARDESPSPPNSPACSPLTQAAPVSDVDSMVRPISLASEARQPPRPENTSLSPLADTWLRSSQPLHDNHETDRDESNSPDRWWTFTLPPKYRSKLHEHHLRMAFYHERMKNNLARSQNKSNEKSDRTEEREKKNPRSNHSSRDESADSDYPSDDASHDSRERARSLDGGLGAVARDGAAAGLGTSGLLNWSQRGRRPTSESRHHDSSQSDAGSLRTKTRDSLNSPRTDPDKQSQLRDDETRTSFDYPTMSFRARIKHPDVYTLHQAPTPGWASPWKPEERGGNSIEIGGYRFGSNGYFPRTDTRRSYGSRDGKKRKKKWIERWENFLIHNPFVPLLFRFVNICFTTATLVVAICLYRVLQREGATEAVGSSALISIIFAPLTLVHVAFQIWIEYFGSPIGLWTVQSKLFYTTIEIFFVCFWSAELSLAFDNYLTSTLVCSSFGNPYTRLRNSPYDRPNPLINMSKKSHICRLQGALIGLAFVSLLAYVIVLVVSLFRIFVRATGARR